MADASASLTSTVDLIQGLLVPEQETPRGRKRRRSLSPYALVSSKTLSGDSATFRGRGRYRSSSRLTLSSLVSALPSRASSKASKRDRSASHPDRQPRMKQFRLLQLGQQRRRSQSPSRSQSMTNDKQVRPQKRRQRTQSRSRKHGGGTAIRSFEIKQASRIELLVHRDVAGNKEK